MATCLMPIAAIIATWCRVSALGVWMRLWLVVSCTPNPTSMRGMGRGPPCLGLGGSLPGATPLILKRGRGVLSMLRFRAVETWPKILVLSR